MARDPLHVVMFPWLAFGHMNPFFKLAIDLVKAGIRVSFISAPKNIQRLPSIPSELELLLQFVEFQLPFVDSLPIGAEATVDITMDENQFLKKSYDLLETRFKKFITCQPLDWIIQDFAAYWAAEIAEQLRIPQIMFSVFSTAVIAFFGPPVSVGDHRGALDNTRKSYNATQVDHISITVASLGAKVLQACTAMVVRSCEEYEGNYLNVAKKIYLKPVIPNGLPPPLQLKKRDNHKIESSAEVFKWLDHRKDKSVVYVGFGSEVKLDREQVYEIAHAQTNFVGIHFLNGTFGLGTTIGHPSTPISWRLPRFIVPLWMEVYYRDAPTCSHSTILVVLPLVIDQGFNARLLVEKGLAVEVEKGDDGTFNGKTLQGVF
ncbi:Udp-glycosyltransferase 91c1 [Thalictrum thalictroides]|uniref:Udp-glycosyltransferase 91c1 n=1 Tax=Thalictrum thalictroides TaxID=46969 RepID=A0A7J6VE60_THATH|nr:Udp-glycosyltransferase 91c1 [Thalictrum thalictroides]